MYALSSRHYQLGIDEFKHGAYADAVREFTQAMRLKPDSAAAFHWRACALLEVRQFGSALADMNRSLSLRPANPVALHARAAEFEHLGRYREAYADIVGALRLAPRNPIYLDYHPGHSYCGGYGGAIYQSNGGMIGPGFYSPYRHGGYQPSYGYG